MFASAMLYKVTSGGKDQQWSISTIPNPLGTGWDIVTEYGQVDGVIQEKVINIAKGKNIGRANETTAEEQADSEAQSKYLKQIDKGYSRVRGVETKSNRPMLAEKYPDFKDRVTFPCYVQPKLDGQRCIAACKNGIITLTSRGNKPITTMQHIIDELKTIMVDGDVFDGELYAHKNDFQNAMSFIKKKQDGSKSIKYHIYDIVSSGDFTDRFVNNTVIIDKTYLKRVWTGTANNPEEIQNKHDEFVNDGYEGLMVRHSGCYYKKGGRSNQLLKVKSFDDAEFKVIDILPGDRSPTHGKFVCLMTNTDTTFTATPDGPFELKEAYLSNKHEFIGKMANVRYFGLTTSGVPVPRFPIMKYIRNIED